MRPNDKVGVSFIAQTLGLTTARVNSLVSDGILTATDDKPRQFVLSETVQAYQDYLRSRIDPKKDDDRDTNSKRLKAEAAYKAAKAKSAQLELEELEGKMHRSDDVEAAFSSFAYAVSSCLKAMPGRTAVDMVQEGIIPAAMSNRASEVIRSQTNDIMQELCEFKYDPDYYAEQVRERMGWTADSDEQAEGSD